MPTDGPVTRRSVQVVTGDEVEATEHPLQGFVDHLVAGGHTAHISTLGACKPDALREADLLMVGQEVDGAGLSEVIAERGAAARPTIAHIESSAIVNGTVPDGGRELATSAAAPRDLRRRRDDRKRRSERAPPPRRRPSASASGVVDSRARRASYETLDVGTVDSRTR